MILDDKKFIGKIIRQYRQKNKLTLAQLAEKTDMSEKHLGQIERGAFSPTISTFFKIVKVLKINIADFGLKYDEDTNKTRETLLKHIYGADEAELKLFFDVIEAAIKYSQKLKK